MLLVFAIDLTDGSIPAAGDTGLPTWEGNDDGLGVPISTTGQPGCPFPYMGSQGGNEIIDPRSISGSVFLVVPDGGATVPSTWAGTVILQALMDGGPYFDIASGDVAFASSDPVANVPLHLALLQDALGNRVVPVNYDGFRLALKVTAVGSGSFAAGTSGAPRLIAHLRTRA